MRKLLTVSIPEIVNEKKIKAMYNMKLQGTSLSAEVAKIIEKYAEEEVK